MKFKAQLTSGEIVELPKDCDCQTHEGPHWIHMDKMWKTKNQKFYKPKENNFIADLAYIKEELLRLKEKQYQLKKHNIAKLLFED